MPAKSREIFPIPSAIQFRFLPAASGIGSRRASQPVCRVAGTGLRDGNQRLNQGGDGLRLRGGLAQNRTAAGNGHRTRHVPRSGRRC